MPSLRTVTLERSAIRNNKTLCIICQVASHSAVYKINILDGRVMCHDKALRPHCILETSMCDVEVGILNRLHRPWHFVCDSTFIYAAPSIENKVYTCCLDQGNINHTVSTWPVGVEFLLVVRVGSKVVGISDSFRNVYHLSQGEWTCHKTSGLPDLDKKVVLSGYVVLSSSTFMVSNAENNYCFLHDKWSVVKPFLKPELLPSGWQLLPSGWPMSACLSEGCMFAKGFVYTCSYGGLDAYELVEQGDSYYLGERVGLQFSWWNCWECNRMCLEYIGEDTSSGAIMFCVVTGDYFLLLSGLEDVRPVRITTVQVKTEEMPDGKLKPKTMSHVDIGTIFVEWYGGAVWTRDCFAAATASIQA
ncbi:hypothetical protein HU200_064637 [Digitaria exilis]|uniref:F-box/kelch-repeat protein n=1 Tax=Digitaria exilis TaxID=1010633 RepID=A0A835A121_9POAL|nr:hypothetical protein HU200_064637 [Digitaria exilis]